jgi:hypothetical protein
MLFILLALCLGFSYSQVKTDTAKRIIATKPLMVNQLRVVSSPKATVIRKDAVNLKSQLSQFQDSVAMLKKNIDNAVDQMKNKPDEKSEMGELESLRLQIAMERISKMMTTRAINYSEFKMNDPLPVIF